MDQPYDSLTRRRFLASSVGLALSGGLAACGKSSTSAPSRRPYAIDKPDLGALQSGITGQVITPTNTGYDPARLQFNAVYDYIRPAAVVQVADTKDVVRTLAFAQANGMALVPRSGGHSFAGYAAGPGLVLGTSRLNSIDISADAKTVRMGAGVMMLPQLEAIAKAGKVLPAGFCPSVAIAGLALGGGIGRLTRTYGLTVDAMRSVEIVTADGRILRADAHTNPDLYWACRGGGGNNFGVVTSFEFDLFPIPKSVTSYTLTWPWAQRYQAYAAWQDWQGASPTTNQGELTFSTGAPGATPTVTIEGIHQASPDKTKRLVDQLISAVGSLPSSQTLEPSDYVSAVKDIFCKNTPSGQCTVETVGGSLSRFALSIKSTFIHGAWPRGALDIITEWLERRQRDPVMTRQPPNKNLGKIWMDALGGAMATVPSNGTAFPYRDATFCVQYQSRWVPDAPEAVQAANVEWLEGFHSAMRKYNRGAYVNYSDPTLVNWPEEYYGSNLPRLKAIKRRYDPGNFFNFPQSIPVA